MPAFIVDTYAWIDYFRGGANSAKLKTVLEGGGNITPTIVLAELRRKYVKEGIQGFDSDLAYIGRKSNVVDLDERTAVLAGEIKATLPSSHGMGLVDCILLAHAKLTGSKVLTGDKHFVGLLEAEMV